MFQQPQIKNQQTLLRFQQHNKEPQSTNTPNQKALKMSQKLFLQRIATKKIKTQTEEPESIPFSKSNKLISPKSSRLIKPFFNQSVTNLKTTKWISMPYIHNSSRNNIRMTLNPLELYQRKRSIIKNSRQATTVKPKLEPDDQNQLTLKLAHQKSGKLPQRKFKQPPSFLKNKFSQIYNNNISIQDFQILKQIEESEWIYEYLALHKKTHAIFQIKRYEKNILLKNTEYYQELKFTLRNIEINHSTLAKCFGFFSDEKYIFLVEQCLQGVTIKKQMQLKKQPFSQTELGSKICDILAAMTYLHSKGYVHGSIFKSNVVNSLNICKLKRPCLKNQKKDKFYDIWCLGNLAYEMATHQQLIPPYFLSEINTIDEIFQSKQIAKCIEVGFKRFQNGSHSRDLIHFLITTLWTVQHKKIHLQQLWQEQFIKLFREDDEWSKQPQSSQQST